MKQTLSVYLSLLAKYAAILALCSLVDEMPPHWLSSCFRRCRLVSVTSTFRLHNISLLFKAFNQSSRLGGGVVNAVDSNIHIVCIIRNLLPSGASVRIRP